MTTDLTVTDSYQLEGTSSLFYYQMAVVCKNKKSLRDCFSSLDSNSRDEYKFFKAICRSLDYDEVRSFYGMYVPNDKITTTVDSASAETLREKFPFTDFTTIEKVRSRECIFNSPLTSLSYDDFNNNNRLGYGATKDMDILL